MERSITGFGSKQCYVIFMYAIDDFRHVIINQSDEFLDEESEDNKGDREYLNDEFEEDDSKDK